MGKSKEQASIGKRKFNPLTPLKALQNLISNLTTRVIIGGLAVSLLGTPATADLDAVILLVWMIFHERLVNLRS